MPETSLARTPGVRGRSFVAASRLSRLLFGALLCTSLTTLTGCTIFGDSAWNGVHASASLGYQEVALDGSIDTNTEVSPGVFVTTEFDLEDNGGQDESQAAIYASAQVGIAPFELRASGFEYSNEASGVFNGEFLGTTFTGPVDTDFQLIAYKATLGFDLINLERIRVGAMIGATVLDLDLAVTSSLVPGVEETLDEVVPAPVVGARVDVKVVDPIRIGGELTLLPLDEVEDFDVSFVDWELGVHFEPLPYLEIFGLYRNIHVEVDGEIDGSDAAVDLGISGPVVGVAITF